MGRYNGLKSEFVGLCDTNTSGTGERGKGKKTDWRGRREVTSKLQRDNWTHCGCHGSDRTGRAKAKGQFPREGERVQSEMQLPQKVQKRAAQPGKVCFEYLPLKIYVIVAKSPNLQRCPTVDLSNKTTKCICAPVEMMASRFAKDISGKI